MACGNPILPVIADHGEGNHDTACVVVEGPLRLGPSVSSLRLLPPPHRFATGRIV